MLDNTNKSITAKLARLSNTIRNKTNNPRYEHGRVISKNGVPYLKFSDFNIIYLGSTRVYRVIFKDQSKVNLVYVPKRYSSFDYGHIDKCLINLESQYRAWMIGKTYKGSLYI